MRRRGRRTDRTPVVRRGDRVIDGHVRARLLGLQLLEIDARVVVTTAGNGSGTAQGIVGYGAQTSRAVRSDGTASSELVRAVRLLAEGTSALDDARRLR